MSKASRWFSLRGADTMILCVYRYFLLTKQWICISNVFCNYSQYTIQQDRNGRFTGDFQGDFAGMFCNYSQYTIQQDRNGRFTGDFQGDFAGTNNDLILIVFTRRVCCTATAENKSLRRIADVCSGRRLRHGKNAGTFRKTGASTADQEHRGVPDRKSAAKSEDMKVR